MHVPSSVEAFEPEEVGVEQLLRDIKDVTISSLSNQVPIYHHKIFVNERILDPTKDNFFERIGE